MEYDINICYRSRPGVLRRIYPYCGSYGSQHIRFCMQGTVR